MYSGSPQASAFAVVSRTLNFWPKNRLIVPGNVSSELAKIGGITPPAFTWGTLGRNSLNAPPLYNLDLSAAKRIRFGESRELQFRTEFFNSLNHPEFGLPNATVGVTGAGTIATTQRANRQIQFALRLQF